MKALENMALLPDVQSRPDRRGLQIDAVGIKSVRAPISIRAAAGPRSTVAALSMAAGLREMWHRSAIDEHDMRREEFYGD